MAMLVNSITYKKQSHVMYCLLTMHVPHGTYLVPLIVLLVTNCIRSLTLVTARNLCQPLQQLEAYILLFLCHASLLMYYDARRYVNMLHNVA